MGSGKSEQKSEFSKAVRARAGEAMKEVEKIRELIMKELHEGFDVISNKFSLAAKSTSQMTENLRHHVAEIHPREYWDKMVSEVEELRHDLANGISDRFNQLRETTENVIGEATRKSGKKKISRKKTAGKKVGKKKTTGKKTSKKKVTKKKTAKKKATKKKPVGKKATRKKTAKKKTGKKKVSKKPARKKTSG